MDPERGLTRRQFEEVIRRATELAASEPEDDGASLDEAELFRIAREVGLPARHVRRALSELRDPEPEAGPLGALLGPESLRTSRVVPRERGVLSPELDDFFVATQLLQAVRQSPGRLQYRPAVDWASQVARAASSTSGRYYVASAKRVEVHLEEVGEAETLVTLVVDPGTRNDYLAGGAIGALAGGGGAGWGAALLLGAAPLAVTVAGAAAAGASVAGGVAWYAGRAHRRKLDEVRAEMEGILDRLESGQGLEPPPPSWRRWVKRQFHGVARDVFGGGGDEDEGDWKA